jgi:hypothetical protein
MPVSTVYAQSCFSRSISELKIRSAFSSLLGCYAMSTGRYLPMYRAHYELSERR